MNTLKKITTHIFVALCLGLILITILDGFNPMMSFLTSKTSKIYIYATCFFGIVNGIISLITSLDSSGNKQ